MTDKKNAVKCLTDYLNDFNKRNEDSRNQFMETKRLLKQKKYRFNKKIKNGKTIDKNLIKNLVKQIEEISNKIKIIPSKIDYSSLEHFYSIKCEDQVFGILEIFSKKLYPGNEINKKYKNLVLIIESPHKSEFALDEINNISKSNGAASGPTGINLRKYIAELLYDSNKLNKHASLKTERYNLCVLNSIQFQTSCGEDTDKYRDDVFKYLWGIEDINNDFITRLNSYNPRIILNCVTVGNDKNNSLNSLIQEKIDKNFQNNDEILLLKGTHPGNWRPKNIE